MNNLKVYIETRLDEHQDQLPSLTQETIEAYYKKLTSFLPDTLTSRKDIRKMIIQNKHVNWSDIDWDITNLCFPSVTGPFGNHVFPEPPSSASVRVANSDSPLPSLNRLSISSSSSIKLYVNPLRNPKVEERASSVVESSTVSPSASKLLKNSPKSLSDLSLESPFLIKPEGSLKTAPVASSDKNPPPLAPAESFTTIQSLSESMDDAQGISEAMTHITVTRNSLYTALMNAVIDSFGSTEKFINAVSTTVQSWIRNPAGRESPFSPVTIDSVDYALIPSGMKVTPQTFNAWTSLSPNMDVTCVLHAPNTSNDDSRYEDVMSLTRFCRFLKYHSEGDDSHVSPFTNYAKTDKDVDDNEIINWMVNSLEGTNSTMKSAVVYGAEEQHRDFLVYEAASTYQAHVIGSCPLEAKNVNSELVQAVKQTIVSAPYQPFILHLVSPSESEAISNIDVRALLSLSNFPNLFVFISTGEIEQSAIPPKIHIVPQDIESRVLSLNQVISDNIILPSDERRYIASMCLNMSGSQVRAFLTLTLKTKILGDASESFVKNFKTALKLYAVEHSHINPELSQLISDESNLSGAATSPGPEDLFPGIWKIDSSASHLTSLLSNLKDTAIPVDANTLEYDLLHLAATGKHISGCLMMNSICLRLRGIRKVDDKESFIQNLTRDAMKRGQMVVVDSEYVESITSSDFFEDIVDYVQRYFATDTYHAAVIFK